MNARALIGQSAMVYCAGKLMEISLVFWIIILKKIIHLQRQTTWDVGRTLEEFVNHEPQASDLRILLVLFQHPKWFISL